MDIRRHVPWNDRAGRFSALKTAVLGLLLLPGLAIAAGFAAGGGQPGARPVTVALHACGDWSLRFLVLSLAVTPAIALFARPRLMLVRRMVGVAAFAYAALHLTLYSADQKWNLGVIAGEIVHRIYLTIGFGALLALALLAATSADAAIRAMGASRWRWLHRLVYPAAVLALVHFFLQTRFDVSEPVLMSGLFVWLMGFRLVVRGRGVPAAGVLAGLSLAAFAATIAIEALWYGVATTAGWRTVAAANFSLVAGVRPAWLVLAAGLAVSTAARLAARRRLSAEGSPARSPRK
ncbi:ferric reductase-like transmembrane domain-containing protein [Pseudoxanthobacter sp.]|uniref:sulfite oxidase heme-binding subunit YedZ n=1 Tax=Pseudoxanthobacter sp. TaxID=1925742 RepID=UPI002FE03091